MSDPFEAVNPFEDYKTVEYDAEWWQKLQEAMDGLTPEQIDGMFPKPKDTRTTDQPGLVFGQKQEKKNDWARRRKGQ